MHHFINYINATIIFETVLYSFKTVYFNFVGNFLVFIFYMHLFWFGPIIHTLFCIFFFAQHHLHMQLLSPLGSFANNSLFAHWMRSTAGYWGARMQLHNSTPPHLCTVGASHFPFLHQRCTSFAARTTVGVPGVCIEEVRNPFGIKVRTSAMGCIRSMRFLDAWHTHRFTCNFIHFVN